MYKIEKRYPVYMVLYSRDSLDTLRKRIDLIEVLSSHIELNRSGASYKALCPFHDEKTPSFMVQKGDSHYHCFGCGAHGDAIQFLMTHQRLSFHNAIEALAQRFQVHLEPIEESKTQQGPNKTLLKEALAHAARFFHFYLLHTPEGHTALRYLFHRGLDIDFIRRFLVGLAPPSSGMLSKVLEAKSIRQPTLIDAGLLARYNDSGTVRDFFLDRITFPVHDPMGSVIGFSARKYKEETPGGKYINTPETVLFKKSRILFGLNHCRRQIAKEQKALIVEGQIDALRLIHAGFSFTVAGQGTAFGEGHIRELLNLGVKQVFLSLDGDSAGQQATCKIGHLFQKEGIETRVVSLPFGTDPDSFLKQQGAASFTKALENSQDYLTFLVKYHSSQLNLESPAAKNRLVQELAIQIRSWNQPVLVHESLRKLAQMVQVPENMVGVGQEHVPNLYVLSSTTIGRHEIDPDLILESDLLRWLVITGSHSFTIAQLNLHAEDLRVPICRDVYKLMLQIHEKKGAFEFMDLMMETEQVETQEFLSNLLERRVKKDKADQAFLQALQKILDRNWMSKREEIRKQIHSGECSDEQALELVQQFNLLAGAPPKIK